MLPLPLLLAASGAGTLAHVFYFRCGEHHMYGLSYVSRALISLATSTIILRLILKLSFATALRFSSSLAAAFLAGLYFSLLLYRTVLHPLRQFPGPFQARISSLWYSTQVFRGDAQHRNLELHQKYGPFVRIGPSDLSITHTAAVQAVHGLGSPCRKGPWYDEDWPRCSIHTSRDHSFHAHRRRLWSPAFADKALREYEPRIAKYNTILADQLEQRGGEPVSATKWLNWWSFDVMADLAFGSSFGMLGHGEEHWAITLLHNAFVLQRLKLPTWLFRMILAVPGLTSGYWKFIRFCDNKMYDRMKHKVAKPDLMNTLLPQVQDGVGEDGNMLTLLSDARTIIVAGSDTTAATLTNAMFRLAKHPEHIAKIREEILPMRAKDGQFEHIKLLHATHLNAVITETLRMSPVPPSAIQRKTPPEGISIGETFVPGNMHVYVPQHALGHDESVYTQAEEFLPERWYPGSKLVKDPSAYAPFSVGELSSYLGHHVVLLCASLERKDGGKSQKKASQYKTVDQC